MKEQNSIPVSKVERSAKFVTTGAKVGINYLKHYSKKMVNPNHSREELNKENAEDIYNALSKLKGSALKIAQMLSMDKNILPKVYSDKFSLAQYSAPPLSGPLIVRTFSKHFGKTPDQIYDTFNINSKHAASIGQVHQATKNGKKLAVKIQYPGVGDSISSDLRLVKPFAFRLLNMSEAELQVYMGEVEEKLLEETDYILEVQRSIHFSTVCKDLKNTIFPTYYPELSSKRIITMDWLEGIHLKDFLKKKPSQELRNKIGQALWDFYNFQQHELRAVHADPHPGNFLITPDDQLGIIDFGCIKEIPDDFYYPFFTCLFSNIFDDRHKTIEYFRKLGLILKSDTPKQVEFYYKNYKAMISLFAQPYQQAEFDFSKPAFFDELFAWSEEVTTNPKLKQARGAKHFLYFNRTNFGLYYILHDLQAQVKTDTFRPHRLNE
ncbi:ABC1 kinase family protein [Solitalea koreensis]|uniref:Predicted unusual protein kinase regulating ubiquinone biosynthesis, AarF/ABC1/UbiB family n=1 Tax=Solitalea koreensis TaxID=543615 RepID=A0A521ALJ5_9SPHI|nr:AarF/ABC1/UbiB kinase family protein [Solitalea koreensis]SMO35679.1 Predicted unusual protein kinase regulating ubiquinone biosynthesis, AarF/ABC1/UbiB family [Solitalea koreensis]